MDAKKRVTLTIIVPRGFNPLTDTLWAEMLGHHECEVVAVLHAEEIVLDPAADPSGSREFK